MYYILEKMSSKDDFNFHCINIMFHANAIFRITYIICINCVWVECKTDESDIYCKKKLRGGERLLMKVMMMIQVSGVRLDNLSIQSSSEYTVYTLPANQTRFNQSLQISGSWSFT